MKKIIALVFTLALIVAPLTASAANFSDALGKLQGAAGNTGLKSDLGASVGMIIQGALALVGTIFLVLTVYAGILWMTAAGNDEQVGKAKKIVTAAVIGLAITMSAYAITFYVTSKFGG